MKILLLEDDFILNEIIEEFLLSLKYEVTVCFDGQDALEIIYEEQFDLFLFDVNVPNLNGFDLLKELKTQNINTASIFITSRNMPEDLKLGFNLGCDDYIKKPFDLSELQLRIENIKRLRNIKDYGIIRITKDINYNTKSKTIINKTDKYDLSHIESKIFEYLLKNKNRPLSIEEISINNWAYDDIPESSTIRTYIKNLRKKMNKDIISTMKNIGYKLNIED
ncbi:response regulator transcription factor [Arcobacter sp. YIC-464]|uniref:response regulator transcription factor n=1 Tax=Arcobacter sp. YIC-464 TaxID=3376631 RepID=UPI003C1E2CCA